MALTKKSLRVLELVEHDLSRGYDYLMDEQIAVANKCERATTSLHYTRADGACLYELAKHSSNIVGIEAALSKLRAFIKQAKEKKDTE